MLDARIISETEYQQLESDHIRSFWQRTPYVYAHGKLEDDYGTDIVYVNLGGHRLFDGLVAYTTQGKPVRFHLYRHPRTFSTTGIVTYSCEDREAYEYGRWLVREKPSRF